MSVVGLAACAAAPAERPAPFADIHLHYTWNQAELTSPEQVIDTLHRHNVVLAVVAGEPSETALEIRAAGGDWVVALFSPYLDGRVRHSWFRDERVLARAEQGLAEGLYQGLGEIHLTAGLGPRRDNPIFEGLLALAQRYDLPVLIHTEASDYRYFLPVCRKHPQVRFLWAHAGGILPPAQVASLLKACPNVWAELSARDPWHYGNLAGRTGERLQEAWRDLIVRFPDRFMTGTDPVWKAHEGHRWYAADEGWQHYDEFIAFHRNWLSRLPPEIEEKVRLTNALAFFRARPRAAE